MVRLPAAAFIGSCVVGSLAVPATAQVVTGGAPNPSHPGLQMWLDASSGVTESGGQVSYWDDRSAANHDAQQTDPALQPTYVAADPNFANRPTLGFASDLLTSVDSASAMGITGAANRTIFMVFRHTGGNANITGYGTRAEGQIFDSAAHSGELIGHYYGGTYDTLGAGPAYTAGDLAVMTHQYDGTNVAVFGKTVTPGSNAPVSGSDTEPQALNTGDSSFLIGQAVYSPEIPAMTGNIAEILIYNEVLSAGDRAAVEDYLYTKWTTPIPEPGAAALLGGAALALAARRPRRRATN